MALGALPSVYATSAANCTAINCNLHGVTIDIGPPGANPCNGQPATSDAYVTGNFQVHGSADGSHTTGTLEGSVTVVQDNGVVYTGHVKDWFGGNINKGGTSEFSGTAVYDIYGSDGTHYIIHSVSHETITPAGVITVNFNNLTCN
jgi:hypothetical protein